MAFTKNLVKSGNQAIAPVQPDPLRVESRTDINNILEQANSQVRILEQRLQARSRRENKQFELCQNKDELNAWLVTWPIAPNHVSQQLDSATDRREQLDLKRSKGAHRVAASTQRFIGQMSEFSNGYSGLLEVVGGAAGPYGLAAIVGYRALSCLFLAATNKAGNEALVTDRLEEINRFFPRINKMQSIYQDDVRIGVLVALIHLDIVRFADNAAHFFSSPWRRAFDMLVPPDFKSDPTYDSMKTRLVELRAWANVNLHENAAKSHEEIISARGQLQEVRLQQIEASNNLAKTQVHLSYATEELTKIRNMIRRQEEEIEMQLLTALREHLQVDDSSINFDVEECSRLSLRTMKDLSLYRKCDSKTAFMTRDKLEQDASFTRWVSGTHRLLLIGGITTRDLMGLAWTTPAVLELALEWKRKDDGIVGIGAQPLWRHSQPL